MKKSKPTHKQIAEIFNKTERTIRQWVRDGAPVHDLKALHQWYEEREAKRIGSKEYQGLKRELLMVKIDRLEFDLAVVQRKYLLTDTVREHGTLAASNAKQLLRARLENEFPPLLAGLSIERVKAHCERAIEEITERVKQPLERYLINNGEKCEVPLDPTSNMTDDNPKASNDLKCRALQVQIAKQRHLLKEQRGTFISREEANNAVLVIHERVGRVLKRALLDELPASLVGLDTPQIRVRCEKAVDDVCYELSGAPRPKPSQA